MSSSSGNGYSKCFIPVEKSHPSKSSDSLALRYFTEWRFIPFGDKREEYQRQHISIQWRDEILKVLRVTEKSSVVRLTIVEEEEILKLVGETEESRSLQKDFIRCTVNVNGIDRPTAVDVREYGQRYHEIYEELSSDEKGLADVELVLWMVTLISVFFNIEVKRSISNCISMVMEKKLWLPPQYDNMFKKTKELTDLTATPYMVKVVTEILPSLKQQSRTESEIKSSLVLGLGEWIAEDIWAKLKMKEIRFSELETDLEERSQPSDGLKAAQTLFRLE
eukprot:gene520-555_t